MLSKTSFFEATGARFFLDRNAVEEISEYLHSRGWLHSEEQVLVTSKPGDGNMNYVCRVMTNQRTFILKQSRPWVEKFPQIDAPVDRILVEARFYQLISQDDFFKAYTPQLIGLDSSNFLLAMEDLGQGADFTFLYRKGANMDPGHLKALMSFLAHLHHLPVEEDSRQRFPDNMAMRRLNHQHLFIFPLQENNGFNLDTIQAGLQETALPYQRDEELRKRMIDLGEIYLRKGSSLLHGDFFPGSWLKVGEDIKVIDPEFCFFGPAEYDLGVLQAHLMMARLPAGLFDSARRFYQAPPGFDERLCQAFCGMELLRRLIGLAQLPVDLNLIEKANLLAEGSRMVRQWSK